MPGVLLDPRSVHRIGQVVRQAEADGGEPRFDATAVLPNWQQVRVTGAGIRKAGGSGSSVGGTSGSCSGGGGLTYYPGYVEHWDAPNEQIVSLGAVWIREGNFLKLKPGYLYDAKQSGDLLFEGVKRPVFVVSAASAAGREKCPGGGDDDDDLPGVSPGEFLKCTKDGAQINTDIRINVDDGEVVIVGGG